MLLFITVMYNKQNMHNAWPVLVVVFWAYNWQLEALPVMRSFS